MSMRTLFDVIFSTNQTREAALNAHRNSATDDAEETVVAEFLKQEEYQNGQKPNHHEAHVSQRT